MKRLQSPTCYTQAMENRRALLLLRDGPKEEGRNFAEPQSSFLAHQLSAFLQFEVAKNLLIGMLVIQEEMGI